MRTPYNKISYFGFNFDWKSTYHLIPARQNPQKFSYIFASMCIFLIFDIANLVLQSLKSYLNLFVRCFWHEHIALDISQFNIHTTQLI